jgi:acetyl-CoA carboxylase biotin carboxyl carrier protein
MTRVRSMRQEIASDLVANVAQVLVRIGQAVTETEELLLLESMKMEIPVLAEEPGTVAEIRVQTGDVVQEGDVLVVLE